MLIQSENPQAFITRYEQSLIFKHEMIFFPFPGLHKILSTIAQNKQLGIQEAIKQISHLYLYTFQQKEALKALINLWKDKENDHLLIHELLKSRNVSILEVLAKSKPIISPYLDLVDLLSVEKTHVRNMQRLYLGLNRISRDMHATNEHLHNREIIRSLQNAAKLISAVSLKDIYSAVGVLEPKAQFPDELEYLKALKNTSPQLVQIKENLKKVEGIQHLDFKRTALNDQKKQLEKLTRSTTDALYDPFKAIWSKALTNCANIIESEIDHLQGSALFDAHLVNQEILTTEKNQSLHFKITNKGRELGQDISFTLQTDSAALSPPNNHPQTIDFMEPGQFQKIHFPITVRYHGKVTATLNLTFSDRSRQNKQETFSFPITITQKKTEFKKIINPYIAGPALAGTSTIFMGRNDIYQFIDQNILPNDQHQHNTIIFHGLRRTGKSSLLYLIQKKGFTDKRLVPINIDIQGIEDEKDLYLTFSEKILKHLNLPHSPDNPKPVDGFGQFKRFLDRLVPFMDDKIPVLMLDEFEELQMRVEDGLMPRSVFSNLRHLMQHKKQIIFLFCGTHKIEEMKADYWSIFFNTALYRRVGKLPQKDAKQLIQQPVKDSLNYDELAIEHILTMSGQQPYLIQLICMNIVNALNNHKKRNDALVNDVDEAVEKIIAEDNDNFSQEAWKEANHLKRMILSTTAQELTLKALDQIHLEDILEKLEGLIRDFNREKTIDTLDQLTKGEILIEKNLNYRFNIDMMRKWIATKHPVRKVRG